MHIILPEKAQYIIDTLYKNDYEAFVVGGCVRDSLLNKLPSDWDITTNAPPDRIMELFKNTIPTGLKHGTVTVILENTHFEVTTYRIDMEYKDNRHPEKVLFANSINDDLGRRDFTINAMAYNYHKGLIDPFGGEDDLKKQLIKCVGIPSLRFKEDALRMLRAIRFACQLGFHIDDDSRESLKDSSALLKNISSERIRDEFTKILVSELPGKGLFQLIDSGLIDYILPELRFFLSIKSINENYTLNSSLLEHTLKLLDSAPSNLALRLSAILYYIVSTNYHGTDSENTLSSTINSQDHYTSAEFILKRLKYDNITIKKVLTFLKEYKNGYQDLKNGTIKKFIIRVGIENLDDLFKLQAADLNLQQNINGINCLNEVKNEVYKILSEKHPLTLKDLDITGDDLINLGFIKGKKIGEILNFLLERVLENPKLNTKKQLIIIAKTKLGNN